MIGRLLFFWDSITSLGLFEINFKEVQQLALFPLHLFLPFLWLKPPFQLVTECNDLASEPRFREHGRSEDLFRTWRDGFSTGDSIHRRNTWKAARWFQSSSISTSLQICVVLDSYLNAWAFFGIQDVKSEGCKKNRISTPLKFKMEPEKKSLEKEIPFGNHHFQVPC